MNHRVMVTRRVVPGSIWKTTDQSFLFDWPLPIREWCEENCEGTWQTRSNIMQANAEFELEEDAVLFRLRWA